MEINKNLILACLVFFAVLFYFFILNLLGGFDFVFNSIYSTGDSLEYSDYSKWILGEIEYCNPIRTFFYPLLIIVASILPGNTGLWLLQFLLWLSACILIYFAVLNITSKVPVATIAFLLTVINISLIVYTAHALTEITAFFLLSLLSFSLSISNGRPQKLFFILILSVLVSAKPVFFIIFCFFLIVFIAVRRDEFIRKPLIILLLFLYSSPVIIQAVINKIKHDTYSITQVADINIKQYFYRKTKYWFENRFTPDIKSNFTNVPDSAVLIQKQEASMLCTLCKHDLLVFPKDYYLVVQ